MLSDAYLERYSVCHCESPIFPAPRCSPHVHGGKMSTQILLCPFGTTIAQNVQKRRICVLIENQRPSFSARSAMRSSDERGGHSGHKRDPGAAAAADRGVCPPGGPRALCAQRRQGPHGERGETGLPLRQSTTSDVLNFLCPSPQRRELNLVTRDLCWGPAFF